MKTLAAIDHIYIMHHPRAVERRKAMDAWIAANNFAPEYVEYASEYKSEELTSELLKRVYLPSIAEHAKRAASTSTTATPPGFPLNLSEIATTLEHARVWDNCIQKKYNRVLILEDDVLFVPNFAERWNSYSKEILSDAEIISIGDGFDMHIDKAPYNITITSEKHFYKNPLHHMRCSDSYVITMDACKKILSTFLPFALPIDWELNYQLALHDIQVYWLEPTLVRQGTWTGAYPSLVH